MVFATSGDSPGTSAANDIATLQYFRQAFNAAPDFQAADAINYVKTFQISDREMFWTAPEHFFKNASDPSSTFSKIYERGLWGGGSGPGSDLSNSVPYAAYIQHLLDRFDIRSIVDLGCGDWRFTKFLDFKSSDYLGIDVVAPVIAANRAAFGSDRVKFEVADITSFNVPPCDLLLCKDVMQHLSNANVRAILDRSSAARIAVFTNDYHAVNEDCSNGDTRPLDITAQPFFHRAVPRLAYAGKVTFVTMPSASAPT